MWNQNELLTLVRLSGKIDAFGNNDTDEFAIIQDGKRQGIFKSWSIPVIPFLDFGNIDILTKLWPDITRLTKIMNFWQALATLKEEEENGISELALSAIETLEEWRRLCLRNPVYLARSLERARLNSWILDLELTQTFNDEPLSCILAERIKQLANRLELSLLLLSPFYHLEALVGDPEWLYGSEVPAKSLPGSGKLDVIAFLLPSALRNCIVASRSDWHGLSWESILQVTQDLLSDPAYQRVILNISRIAGIPPHHVLFVANSLEWIPTRVGGKKEDPVSTREAMDQLANIVCENEPTLKDKNAASVLSDINALIRFLNWVPLIEGNRNFQGLDWTYSSVCDTSNALMATLSDNPNVWRSDFRPVFEQELKQQLEHLDATSAKGRFLLQLIGEKRLKPVFTPSSDSNWKSRVVKQAAKSFSARLDIPRTVWPRSLVGDKLFGLLLASLVLGTDHAINGFVITSDEVESLLRAIPRIWRDILRLNREQDLNHKVEIALQIQRAIGQINIPQWLSKATNKRMNALPKVKNWAIRSSSLEEGEARGIYASYLQVPSGKVETTILDCIASFFSKGAVMFRITSQAGDLPTFAVLVQPYKQGIGGVATRLSQEESRRVIVNAGSSAAVVTSNGRGVQKLNSVHPLSTEVSQIFGDLERVFGHIQIEWVKSNKIIQLLQLDLLAQTSASAVQTKPCDFTIRIRSTEEMGGLEQKLKVHQGTAAVILGPEIKLDSFQGELLSLIARFGQRIGEVRTTGRVTETSHFANICRHFGIRLL